MLGYCKSHGSTAHSRSLAQVSPPKDRCGCVDVVSAEFDADDGEFA